MEEIVKITRHRSSTADHSSILAATQSDRARLIYSAPFRRLQQKAQVFSLESNSAVRSRLTHSIEVSHIGRYIVAKITEMIATAENISPKDKAYWSVNGLSISNIVETACLMHDIGNPPFGHFGEAAIIEWAKSKDINDTVRKAIPSIDSLKVECLLEDFINFDGNPQGFRVITKLQGDDGFNGLNLTFSQLTSFLKYTHSPETKKSNPNLAFTKKIGFFGTEKELIHKAWAALGMNPHSRHPLGFLMEASDDISYCISDIEDGLEKGIITFEHFKKHVHEGFERVLSSRDEHCKYKKLLEALSPQDSSPIGAFLSFKTRLQNLLVEDVAEIFVKNYYEFIAFKVNSEIICKGTLQYDVLKVLKVYTGEYLFSSSEAEKLELSGFSIISGILDEYHKLLALDKDKFSYLVTNDTDMIKEHNLSLHRRLYNRLPSKHVKAYVAALLNCPISPNVDKNNLNQKMMIAMPSVSHEIEWNLRAHLIVDFVSGMTDQFSMEFFQMLKGINVN